MTVPALKKQKLTQREITCTAPVNIAVIKYWGKRDTALILPTNSSLSVTLNQDDLKTTTTVRLDEYLTTDKIFLNGKEENILAKRLQNVITACRESRKELENDDNSLPRISEWGIIISSSNNFPTAAGLASSASGYACLTFALANIYELKLSTSEISRFARIGSGSACRSLFGGFVKWEMGLKDDGSDSLAVQVAAKSDWPDIEALILVVSDSEKDVGSTIGMQESVATSTLFEHRINNIVPDRMKKMEQAINDKDFDSFAELTMKDSNQFHAVCADTYPPIYYMNDVSRAIVRLITAYNRSFESVEMSRTVKNYRVAYTFDAGPNAVLYVKKEYVKEVFNLVNYFFPQTIRNNLEYYGDANSLLDINYNSKAEKLAKEIKLEPFPNNLLQRIIRTSVGDGPRIIAKKFDVNISQLNKEGVPINFK